MAMGGRYGRAVRWRAVLLVSASAVSASGGAASAGSADTVLSYDFKPVSAADGTSTVLGSGGSASVQTSVVTANGGRATTVSSRATQGKAVQFPAFDPSASGARAVIKVVNTTSTDQLAPGDRDFSWSADFRLNADSASHASGSQDNGNNLVQRGLYNDTQFKLDADARRPACRLRGSTGDAGALRVTAPVTVAADQWYNATCTRSGNTLTVSVQAFASAGNVTRQWTNSARSSAGFGTVAWAAHGTPLAIGGKLSATGDMVDQCSDQFNGAVDNVTLTFG
jgi:hypothetical protein